MAVIAAPLARQPERQGDIVERKYKVIQINNTSVIIEDVLNNNRQTIPVTAK